MAEGIYKSKIKHPLKWVFLPFGKTCRILFASWVVYVNVVMSNIKITWNDNRFFELCFHLENMFLKVDVPLIHSVIKSLQSISSIWHIGNYQYEIFELSSDRTAFAVVFSDTNIVPDVEWINFWEDCCPRIPLLYFAAIPELIILSWKVLSKLDLIYFFLINLGLIEAYNIWVGGVQEFLQRLFS